MGGNKREGGHEYSFRNIYTGVCVMGDINGKNKYKAVSFVGVRGNHLGICYRVIGV